jgi:putative membrane protein
MTGFLLRAAVAALGLWAATRLVNGVVIDDPYTLLAAGALLGLVNAIVRPIVLLLTLPLSLISLGLFIFVINAGMLALVAAMLNGFHLSGFRAALLGALVVSISGWIGSWFIGPKGRINVMIHRQ